MNWPLLGCLASFVGFSLIVIIGNDRDANLALFAMAVTGFLIVMELLATYTN